MRLFVALNDQGAEALSRGLFAGESIERALASYDAALGLREDVIVRLERETVATAGALLRRDAAVRPPQSWTSAAPLAAAVALAWERDRRPGPFEIPPQTSPEDLRCTGLLAYLCSDVAGAIRSWGPLESDVAFDDPLIAAALGSAWLALDRPALAAPRLARAVREFPESAPLRFDLADALIRVGDLTRGEAELRAAAPYFGDRPACVRDRPAADLALAKGERAEARARYDAAQRSPTTSLHHAAFLSSEGEFAEAFERAADAYAPFPRIPRFRRFMLDLLEPAFGALDRSARLDVLCEAATSGETYAPLYAIGASLR
jgi:tetratricopeptide (TPR) repeat protein